MFLENFMQMLQNMHTQVLIYNVSTFCKLLIETPIKLLHGVNISCNQNRLKISKVATEHEFNLIPNINFGDMLDGFFSIFISYASLKIIKGRWYSHFSK